MPPPKYSIMFAGSSRTGKSALARLFLDASIPYPLSAAAASSVARFVAATSRPTRRIRSCATNILLPSSESSQLDSSTTSITTTTIPKEDDTRELCLELVDTPPLDVAAGPEALDRSLAHLLAFVEARFAKSDKPEHKARRADDHVHLCLYLLDPERIVPPTTPPVSSQRRRRRRRRQQRQQVQQKHEDGEGQAEVRDTLVHPHNVAAGSSSSAGATTATRHQRPSRLNERGRYAASSRTIPGSPPVVALGVGSGGPSLSRPSSAAAAAVAETSGTADAANVNANVNVNGGGESGTGTGAWNGRENDDVVVMPVSVSVSPRDAHMASGERTPVSGTGIPSWPASAAVDHPDPRAPRTFTHPDDDGGYPNSAPAEPTALFASVMSDTRSFAGSDADADADMRMDMDMGMDLEELDMDSESGFSSDVDEANGNANNDAFLNDGGPVPANISLSAAPNANDAAEDEATIPRLHPLDVEAIRVLSARVNVLPVIARADTLGPVRLKKMKEAVRRDLARMGIGFGIFDEGEGDAAGGGGEGMRIPRLPHAVLTPDPPLVRESRAELRRRYAGVTVVPVAAPNVADVPEAEVDVGGSKQEVTSNAKDVDVDVDVDLDMRMEVDAEPAPDTVPEAEADKAGEKAVPDTDIEGNGDGDNADNEPRKGVDIKTESEPQEEGGAEDLKMEGKDEEKREKEEQEKKTMEDEDGKEAEEKPVPVMSSSATSTVVSASSTAPSTAVVLATETENSTTASTATLGGSDNVNVKGRYVRRFRWGDADALDPSHCDFVELRRAVFHHMEVLRDYTHDYLLARFRDDRARVGGVAAGRAAIPPPPPPHGHGHALSPPPPTHPHRISSLPPPTATSASMPIHLSSAVTPIPAEVQVNHDNTSPHAPFRSHPHSRARTPLSIHAITGRDGGEEVVGERERRGEVYSYRDYDRDRVYSPKRRREGDDLVPPAPALLASPAAVGAVLSEEGREYGYGMGARASYHHRDREAEEYRNRSGSGSAIGSNGIIAVRRDEEPEGDRREYTRVSRRGSGEGEIRREREDVPSSLTPTPTPISAATSTMTSSAVPGVNGRGHAYGRPWEEVHEREREVVSEREREHPSRVSHLHPQQQQQRDLGLLQQQPRSAGAGSVGIALPPLALATGAPPSASASVSASTMSAPSAATDGMPYEYDEIRSAAAGTIARGRVTRASTRAKTLGVNDGGYPYEVPSSSSSSTAAAAGRVYSPPPPPAAVSAAPIPHPSTSSSSSSGLRPPHHFQPQPQQEETMPMRTYAISRSVSRGRSRSRSVSHERSRGRGHHSRGLDRERMRGERGWDEVAPVPSPMSMPLPLEKRDERDEQRLHAQTLGGGHGGYGYGGQHGQGQGYGYTDRRRGRGMSSASVSPRSMSPRTGAVARGWGAPTGVGAVDARPVGVGLGIGMDVDREREQAMAMAAARRPGSAGNEYDYEFEYGHRERERERERARVRAESRGRGGLYDPPPTALHPLSQSQSHASALRPMSEGVYRSPGYEYDERVGRQREEYARGLGLEQGHGHGHGHGYGYGHSALGNSAGVVENGSVVDAGGVGAIVSPRVHSNGFVHGHGHGHGHGMSHSPRSAHLASMSIPPQMQMVNPAAATASPASRHSGVQQSIHTSSAQSQQQQQQLSHTPTPTHTHEQLPVPTSASAPSSQQQQQQQKSAMHHMQHHHHGARSVGSGRGPSIRAVAEPDYEYERDVGSIQQQQSKSGMMMSAGSGGPMSMSMPIPIPNYDEEYGVLPQSGPPPSAGTHLPQTVELPAAPVSGSGGGRMPIPSSVLGPGQRGGGANMEDGTGSGIVGGGPGVGMDEKRENDLHGFSKSEWDARQRYKKITVACDFCRSRKLKCDGGRPRCSQCVKREQKCEYKTQVRRRGAGAQVQQRQGQGVETSNAGNLSTATTSAITTNTNTVSTGKDALRDGSGNGNSSNNDINNASAGGLALSRNTRGIGEENGPLGHPPPPSSATGHGPGASPLGSVSAPMGSLQLRPRSAESDHAQHASLPPPLPPSSSSSPTSSTVEAKRGLRDVLALQAMPPNMPMTRRLAAEERAPREGMRLRERGDRGANANVNVNVNMNGHPTASSRQERLAHGHVSGGANASGGPSSGHSGIPLSVAPPYLERSQLAPMPFSAATSPTAPGASNSGVGSGAGASSGPGAIGSGSPGPHAHVSMSGPSAGVGMISAAAAAAAAGAVTDESESASVNAQTRRPRPSQNKTGRVSNYGPKVVACNFCRARKTKCDGQHPTCQSCSRRSLPCSYATDAAVTSGNTPGIGPLRGRRAAQLAAAQQKQQQTPTQQDEQENASKTSDDQRTASPSNSRCTGSRSPPVPGSAVVGMTEGVRESGGKRGFESPLALHPAPGGRAPMHFHESQSSPGLHGLAALASASASASASVSARSSPPALSSASSSTSMMGLASLSMSASAANTKITNAPAPTTPSSAMALPRSSSKRTLDEDDLDVAESGGRRGAGRNAVTGAGGSVLDKDAGADTTMAATAGSGATRSPSGSKTSGGGSSHSGGAGSPPLPPSNKKVKYDEEARLVGIGASA